MGKAGKLFTSMFKIGLIGFGGGNALIPVIEKTVIDEQQLVSKEEYDVDVMVASITPGALPVEISAGIGKRTLGSYGLILGAVAMAAPGVLLTILLSIFMSNIDDSVLRQISFISVGVYSFICCLLVKYILGTIEKSKEEHFFLRCMIVIAGVVILVCGKNFFRILPGDIPSMLSLSTIQVFALAFFVIFYTRCLIKRHNLLISAVCVVIFVLCNCRAHFITSDIVKYADYVVMTVLAGYGLLKDVRKGVKVDHDVHFRNSVKELIVCILIVVIFSIPAFFVTKETISFAGSGLLSSIISFGGGDAYLTVADGMFVNSGMITEDEFYSSIVPLVNVLPGSILCKTLSGIGYYIGFNVDGNILSGILVAVSGFMVSVAASCGVFSIVAGLYEKFGTLNLFKLIKKWIRPMVSGLLVNVMLSLVVQIKKMGATFDNWLIPFAVMILLFALDEVLFRVLKLKNESIAFISVILSLVICNTIYMI